MKRPDFALKEAMLRDPEIGEAGFNRLCEESKSHPIIGRALKEGLFGDAAAALTAAQTQILDPVYPYFLSREVLSLIRTTKIAERFHKGLVGYTFDNAGNVLATGPKSAYQDIGVNKTYTEKQEWDQNFVEDVSWDVAAFESRNIPKSIAKQENADVVTLFNAIAAANLAGGAEQTITNGAPTWAEITVLIKKLLVNDYFPTHIFMNPDEFGNLFNIAEFMSSLYNETKFDGDQHGTWLHQKTGIKFISCSQATKVIAVDSRVAGILLLRSDIIIQPWENRADFIYGMSGRERLGLGVLYPLAVARGTN